MLFGAYESKRVEGIPFALAVKAGLANGVKGINFFGRSSDIDTADGFKAIWNGSGEYTGHNAIAEEVVTILSDNPVDSGIILLLRGLDEGFNEIYETVVLASTSVTSSLKYMRLQEALVVSENTVNVGSITIAQSITTVNIFAIIAPEVNRTLLAVYTVPANKKAFITSGFATISKKASAVCEIRAKVRVLGGSFQIAEWFSIDSKASSYVKREFEIPLNPIGAGTDIVIEANTDTNNIKVAAGLSFYLVDI